MTDLNQINDPVTKEVYMGNEGGWYYYELLAPSEEAVLQKASEFTNVWSECRPEIKAVRPKVKHNGEIWIAHVRRREEEAA
jgi:hypothetical protein